jgi:hypothetical protein
MGKLSGAGPAAGILALILTAPLMASRTVAAEVQTLTVSHREAVYQVQLEARVAAPPAAVWATLTDFPRLHRLSPALQLSQDLGPDPEGHRLVHTRSHICVWIFCRDLEQVQRMRPGPGWRLQAETLPESGDFRSGRMVWRLAAEGAATRVQFSARLQPAFRVPPLLGPLVVQRGLRGYALEALEGVERAAREVP